MSVLSLGLSADGWANLTYEPGHDPGLGFNTVSWWNYGWDGPTVWANEVQRMYDYGLREVSLSPLRFVTPGTGQIASSSQRAPDLEHVEAAVARATSLGMTVTVNPFVELENFSTWRGFYNPTPGSNEAETFWDDYTTYVVDVAEMAETYGVDAMTIGTELKTLVQDSGHNTDLTSLIDQVDAVFSGQIGYAANWDNFTNSNLTATVWDHPAVDFVGIDAYFRVVTPEEADNSDSGDFEGLVVSRWTELIDTIILPFAQARQGGDGLPVKFTEYGATPFNRGIAIASEGHTVDLDEQLKGFRGLLRALDGYGDVIESLHVWQWGMPGSYNSEFHIDPARTSNISGGFDESLNRRLGQMLVDYAANPFIPGDYNGDGVVDASDIDLLMSNLGDDSFDLDGDGQADAADLTMLVEEVLNTAFGDANLDRRVDLLDLSALAASFEDAAGWSSGDFNGDGVADLLDLSTLASSFGFESLVPEPAAASVVSMLVVLTGRRGLSHC
ncbi:hypothetical protein Pan265_13960 [Mucisphaera calidilacus]|uniref:Uncharacterized protein n=2 Tax=Mucisphaera calidilacus TaxID=2527982 RepID=A0A518BX54_9BACT|nr:hypothetical protein Pan265_13960 [Mucisphaera calidilacus]